MIKLTRSEKATVKDRQQIKDLKKELRDLKRQLKHIDDLRLHYYNKWIAASSDLNRIRKSLWEIGQ